MKVSLVSWSQGSDPKASLENMVAYCARVSNPGNQANTENNARLLKYLIRNQHWSPFEMVSICLEIETTRDIGRQILRHRFFLPGIFAAVRGCECRSARTAGSTAPGQGEPAEFHAD